MIKVVVTGSRGFIGRGLVQRLKQFGYCVIEFEGDILDNNAYNKLIAEDIRHCFHLAAKSFVPDSWRQPAEFMSVNVTGTARVLEFCRSKNCSFTFVSSYLYGAPHYLPIDEKHPLQTPNPYALSKRLAEELCQFYVEQYKMKITVIRPFNIYGPGQDERFLIPELISKFKGTDEIVEVKDLTPRRDYVFITDLIEALVKTLEVTDNYLVMNIGGGSSLSVGEIVEKIKSLTKSDKVVKSSDEVRPNEIPDTVANIKLANEKLGWKPKVSFEDGIREILNSQNNGSK